MCIWNISVSDRRGKDCIETFVFLRGGKVVHWNISLPCRRENDCFGTSVFLAGVERSVSVKELHCKISAPGGTGEFMERFIIQHMYTEIGREEKECTEARIASLS